MKTPSPRQLVEDNLDLPTLSHGPGHLSHEYIVPVAQQLKLSSISPNVDSSSHSNSHYGNYINDNNLHTTSL